MDENKEFDCRIDGDLEFQMASMRDWFGLKEGQTFKDIPEE